MAELFYVMGPSGAGKDSLLRYARDHLDVSAPVVFAHRYITRSAGSGGENHISLSEIEFQRRQMRGCFAMCWGEHGLSYGIGIEIHQWLINGLNVVVNGSRGYFDEAARHYPEIRPVSIQVSPEILAERLRHRGREFESQIDERLQRARAFAPPRHPRLAIIENNGDLSVAGQNLIRIVSEQSPSFPIDRLEPFSARAQGHGSMDITFIGTGDSAGVPVYGCDCGICRSARKNRGYRRKPCSALVKAGSERILIDAGVMNLVDRFPSGSLTRILLTHYHVDHVQGLFQVRWGCNAQIPVSGPADPEGCADLLKHPGILDFSDTLSAFETRQWEALRVTSVPLNHSKQTLGYALEHSGERLAYLTDTAGLPDETRTFLRRWRPHLLVLDCAYPPRERLPRNHNDLNAALAIHDAVRPQRSYLTHIGHSLDQWSANGLVHWPSACAATRRPDPLPAGLRPSSLAAPSRSGLPERPRIARGCESGFRRPPRLPSCATCVG